LSIINIEVSHDRIVIEGVVVPRPNGIAVSTWMMYWNDHAKGSYNEGYTRGYNDGERDAQDRNRGH
jgi:hypothetical protein